MSYDFFYSYFVFPGYNIVNTTVYAILFVLGAYLIFILLKKIGVKIDKKLALASSPFVVLGSSIRVLVDEKILESFLLISPAIYIVISIFSLSCLAISLLVQKKYKIPYFKTLFLSGLVLISLPLSMIRIINFYGALLVALFLLPWLVLLAIAKWLPENKIASFLHIFDATTTFASINFFGYAEQHVVPNFFINFFGSSSFILLKALAVVLILFLIDRYCKNKEFKNYLKLVIGILGAATGTRDFLRMLALT
jgi:uncharacterized membrane protein